MTSSPDDRRSRRAARRAEARRGASNAAPTPRWLLPGLIGGAVVVAALVALVLPGIGGSGGGGATLPPSASADAGTSGAPSAKTPVISGDPLPAFEDPASDPAVGMAAPEIDGADFMGTPVAIEADGRPKVVLFLSHACPHCQAEVPVVQDWLDAGGLPDGVDLVSVASRIDPTAPNYPPDAWLEREGWTAPVIVDPTDSVMNAYGLTAFPFWAFIEADGTVRARTVGELTPADLDAAIRGLTSG